MNQVKNYFSTLNADNTLRLFARGRLRPSAELDVDGGNLMITPQLVSDRINQWLRIRHAVAHGAGSLPREPGAVRGHIRMPGAG